MQPTAHFLSGSLPMSLVFTTFVAKQQKLTSCCLSFRFEVLLDTKEDQWVSVEC